MNKIYSSLILRYDTNIYGIDPRWVEKSNIIHSIICHGFIRKHFAGIGKDTRIKIHLYDKKPHKDAVLVYVHENTYGDLVWGYKPSLRNSGDIFRSLDWELYTSGYVTSEPKPLWVEVEIV